MRHHSGDERTPKPSKIPGRFIPNKPNEPQLGRLRVRDNATGKTVVIPMNRKGRRTAIRAERRRLRHEEKKASQHQGVKADEKGEDSGAGRGNGKEDIECTS